MKNTYPRCFLFIVDNLATAFSNRYLRGKEAIYWSTIASIHRGYKIPVINAPNIYHAAMFISYLYIKENRTEPYVKPVERKGETLQERVENIVAASGPGIGRVKAQALLTEYGSIENIAKSLDTLVPVKGAVYQRDIALIQEAFRADYRSILNSPKQSKSQDQ